MTRPRREFVGITRPAQLKALASPLRQELVDVLESAGPSSVAELGERLGRAADSLYFHLRVLVKVGLVVETERRQVGRHAFAVYDLVGRPLRIDRELARRVDLSAVVAGILRLAARDYRRGLGGSGAVASGPSRNHWGGRARGWLDARGLARVNELLEELNELVRSGQPGKGRQPVALAWVLAPTPARPTRGRRRAKR
ncbi:MAG: helix-turn-helix transcriptional regulator [Planctomycetes bacterium]|nr:helix-turn-helix transcriptional regulator [Planctomycetota bacterium]